MSAVAAVALAIVALCAVEPASVVRAESHDISIVDFEYKPATLTVATGEPVTWTNAATRDHTVTSDTGTELAGDPIQAGEAYGHVFEQPGVYAYHCRIHPQMHGTVTVVAAAATAVPSGSQQPTPPAGTLPPNFSPFPSAGPLQSEPAPAPTPAPSAAPSGTSSAGGPPAWLLILLGAIAIGAVIAVWLRRRRTA